MCVCGIAVIYSKRKLETLVRDTDAHLRHLRYVFFSTLQNILIHHSQHSPCSLFTQNRCTHSCISEQTNAETLTNSDTVIIKVLTQDLFFPSVSNYISQKDGSSDIKCKKC